MNARSLNRRVRKVKELGFVSLWGRASSDIRMMALEDVQGSPRQNQPLLGQESHLFGSSYRQVPFFLMSGNYSVPTSPTSPSHLYLKRNWPTSVGFSNIVTISNETECRLLMQHTEITLINFSAALIHPFKKSGMIHSQNSSAKLYFCPFNIQSFPLVCDWPHVPNTQFI